MEEIEETDMWNREVLRDERRGRWFFFLELQQRWRKLWFFWWRWQTWATWEQSREGRQTQIWLKAPTFVGRDRDCWLTTELTKATSNFSTNVVFERQSSSTVSPQQSHIWVTRLWVMRASFLTTRVGTSMRRPEWYHHAHKREKDDFGNRSVVRSSYSRYPSFISETEGGWHSGAGISSGTLQQGGPWFDSRAFLCARQGFLRILWLPPKVQKTCKKGDSSWLIG